MQSAMRKNVQFSWRCANCLALAKLRAVYRFYRATRCVLQPQNIFHDIAANNLLTLLQPQRFFSDQNHVEILMEILIFRGHWWGGLEKIVDSRPIVCHISDFS